MTLGEKIVPKINCRIKPPEFEGPELGIQWRYEGEKCCNDAPTAELRSRLLWVYQKFRQSSKELVAHFSVKTFAIPIFPRAS